MMLKDFNETFDSELADPEFAALYLKAALQDNGMEGFFLALRNVARANAGVEQGAVDLVVSGNPPFTSIQDFLGRIGLQLSVEPLQDA